MISSIFERKQSDILIADEFKSTQWERKWIKSMWKNLQTLALSILDSIGLLLWVFFWLEYQISVTHVNRLKHLSKVLVCQDLNSMVNSRIFSSELKIAYYFYSNGIKIFIPNSTYKLHLKERLCSSLCLCNLASASPVIMLLNDWYSSKKFTSCIFSKIYA